MSVENNKDSNRITLVSNDGFEFNIDKVCIIIFLFFIFLNLNYLKKEAAYGSGTLRAILQVFTYKLNYIYEYYFTLFLIMC